jgi:hypothetical protein
MPNYPFEVGYKELLAHLDEFVTVVVDSLESDFLVLPKGKGFVEYPVFRDGYEALKQGTSGFTKVNVKTLLAVVERTPLALIVLRSMLGFTPPEWAYLSSVRTGVDVSQGAVRSLDRGIRWIDCGSNTRPG